MEYLSEFLILNNTITNLNLASNSLGNNPEVISKLIDALRQNETITDLDLTDNLSKEMQDDSFHKLQGNKKAFSMKVQSTEDYNRSVTAVENSYAHPVGFTSKSLGLPSDCR